MERLCTYRYTGINSHLGACGAPEGEDAHIPAYHEDCTGVDRAQCMLHAFQPGEALYILNARKVREAAVAVADLAPPLAEALHLRAQDIFEAGEREARLGIREGRHIVVTGNSVWLVEVTGTEARVIDRGTFGSPYIEPGRRIYGAIVGGKVAVGSHILVHDEGTGGPVTSGTIVAIHPGPA